VRYYTVILLAALPLGAFAQPAITPMDPAPMGYQWVELASIASGSAVEEFNALVSPDLVVGDHLLMPTVTTPGDYTVVLYTDGHIEYDDGEDASRQTAYGWAWDTSAAAWHADDFEYIANNIEPEGGEPLELALLVNSAMTPIDLDEHFSDGDGDTLTYSLISGTHPTGVSLASGVISGTPTVENEAGVTLVYEADDGYYGTGTKTIFLRPLVTLPASDCTTVDTTQGDCEQEFGSDFNNSISFVIVPEYSETVDADIVISQDPVAATEMAPYTTVSLVVSLGACDEGGTFADGTFADGTFADGTFAGGGDCDALTVEVPNVIGEASVAAAEAILELSGLDIGTDTASCSSLALNVIIGQDPTAGTDVEVGSLVNVIYSNGTPCANRGRPGVRLRGLRMPGL
jgi:hypothetical protein